MPDPEITIPVGIITEAGGAHLSAYYEALRDCPEVNDVVIADPSGNSFDAAHKVLEEKLAAAYENPARMLMVARPAMVLVSMEAANTPPVIDRALDAGCHVFAEKPACVRAEDFEPLVKKAEISGLHLMFAFANRLNPAVLAARQLIDEGRFGDWYGAELHLVADQTRLTREAYRQTWFADRKRAGGGHLAWLGIHWLDLAMHLTGHSIREVAGFATNIGGQPVEIEDSAALAMKFDNGMLGTMTSGYYLDRRYHSHIRLWGSHGWLEITEHLGDRQAKPLAYYSTKDPATEGIIEPELPEGPRGYSPFVRACVRAAAGLAGPPVTGADGLQALRTVFGLYEASKSGKTVKLG